MDHDGRDRDGKREKPRYDAAAPAALERAAIDYLQRYASSAAGLRRVLLRRVERSARRDGADRKQGAVAVEAIIEKLLQRGLLNDRTYGEAKARSLQARGTSRRATEAYLTAKGLAREDIAQALAARAEGPVNPELSAALVYCRKRRIGPYRNPEERVAAQRRDMAALARRGFAYGVVHRIMEVADLDALEEEAAGPERTCG
jgi:regulatory protein